MEKYLNCFFFFGGELLITFLVFAIILNHILTGMTLLKIELPIWLWLLLILGPPTYITLINAWQYLFEGRRNFIPRVLKDSNTPQSKEKQLAMHPKISKKYLSKKLEGYVIGKKGKEYVREPFDPNNVKNNLIIGGPGSYKSVSAIVFLLTQNFIDSANRIVAFVVDPKGELSRKSKYRIDKNVHIVNPTDPKSVYGWDAYYGLTDSSNDDELLDRMTLIATALITVQTGDNEFFYQSAINIFSGILIYEFLCHRGFIESIKRINSMPLQDLLAEILTNKDVIKDHPVIREQVAVYEGKDTDSINDVELTLQQNLKILLRQSCKRCFDENPNKASPKDLLSGINVFISLPDHKLQQYAPVLRLIIEEVYDYMFSIPEEVRSRDDAQQIIMILDEFANLGKMSSLTRAISMLRSRKVSTYMYVQSLSQLDEVYGSYKTKTIIDCCENLTIYSLRDVDSAQIISKMLPTYNEPKIGNDKNQITGFQMSPDHVSSEQRPSMDIADIRALRERKEVLFINESGFAVVKKIGYWEIPELDLMNREIVAFNERYDEEQRL